MKNGIKYRKLIIGLLICFVLSFSVFGVAEENLFAPSLITNYVTWAELFGVKNIDEDNLESQQLDDDTTRMYIDMLLVDSNRHTLGFETAMLIYRYPGYTDAEMDLRALALFAAIEYGKPNDFSAQETKMVRSSVMPRLTDMKQMIQNNDLKQSAEPIPIYVGTASVYYLCQISEGVQGILVD